MIPNLFSILFKTPLIIFRHVLPILMYTLRKLSTYFRSWKITSAPSNLAPGRSWGWKKVVLSLLDWEKFPKKFRAKSENPNEKCGWIEIEWSSSGGYENITENCLNQKAPLEGQKIYIIRVVQIPIHFRNYFEKIF